MALRTISGLTLLAAGISIAAAAQPPLQVPLNPPRSLPASAPTQTSAPAALIAAPLRPSPPQHRARVEFAGRTLQIVADNASLNQILREVERLTGLKVTGGVADERVYGNYGPGDTSAVLIALLDGTGSNLMLIVDRNDMPTELVLTPRLGGPTPPSPSAFRSNQDRDGDDNADTPPQLSQHIERTAPPLPNPPTDQPAAAPAAQPQTPTNPVATTTDQSPNGVKTPQQIYDQLLKLQQQIPKPPATNNPQ